MPWGVTDPGPPGDALTLRREYSLPENARVLPTLSRILPEKGQDLLVKRWIEWDCRDDYPREPLWLFICGDAAFMQGVEFFKKLRTLAAKLKRPRVIFPGYVTGERKAAFFALAHLYIYCPRATKVMVDADGGASRRRSSRMPGPSWCERRDVKEFGVIVQPEGLIRAVKQFLENPNLPRMREAARAYALKNRFF